MTRNTWQPLKKLLSEEFAFLITDYACRVTETNSHSLGYSVTYCNATTATKIQFEPREGYLYILLYRLVNGELEENPIVIEVDTPLNGFCLDDIVRLRSPKDAMLSINSYGPNSPFSSKTHGFDRYVRRFAGNLKKYASEVLRGDFSIFPQVEKVVRRRIRSFERDDNLTTRKERKKPKR